MPIRRCHAARAANLDLAHRDPVIGSHHVRVEVDGARAQGVHPHGGRKRDRLLDPDLPIGIPDRNLAEAQVLRSRTSSNSLISAIVQLNEIVASEVSPARARSTGTSRACSPRWCGWTTR
jgi:hypothetical protein